jgi:dihydrofolate synthase/folylpolyglutamate synthase
MDDILKLSFLGHLQRSGIVPGLERMRELMEATGHPQLAYPTILVTGTNGKGSTACLIESILRTAGYRTGRFTSPHLVDVRERIVIDGKMIDEATFAEIGATLAQVMNERGIQATFFEALSAVGFLAFRKAEVDIAVVEIGMGGRFDSTNVAEPVVSVLTNVGLDHVNFLGNSRRAIAGEKVGVARAGRPFVTAVDDDIFDSTVGPELLRVGAVPVRADRDFKYFDGPDGLDWCGSSREYRGLVSGLKGKFQAANIAVAVAAVECLCESGSGFCVDEGAIRKGLSAAVWPGRFQVVSTGPTVIVDGCHNVHAAQSLREDLASLAGPMILVHGSRPEKDYGGVLKLIAPFFDAVIETGFIGGADPVDLGRAARDCVRDGVCVEEIPDLVTAITKATELSGTAGTVVITGSLYMIGAAIRDMGWGV